MYQAPVPRPNTPLVKGIQITTRIKQGIERSILTIVPMTKLIYLFGLIPFLEVMLRMTPTGKPIKYARSVDKMVINSVSRVNDRRLAKFIFRHLLIINAF